MKRRHFALSLCVAPAVLALPGCSDKPGAPAAGPLSAQQAYELSAQGHGFGVGPLMAANTVYVFFDTTCPHCATLWENSKPLLIRLRMVWMPLALLRASSGPQGATILSAADPVAAMTENERSVQANQGGIGVSPALGDEALARVKANTELFRRLGADSVPLIVYRHAGSGAYGMRAGSVGSAELAQLVGI
ncbi:MAG: thioredoxin fold domain-containing protein [Rhizobacter sp.]|nr:thioredoxin fold domain-containing protein [Rhizobacter sp.]